MRIPTIQSRVSSSSVGTAGPVRGPRADAGDFGAAIGGAVGLLGNTMSRTADVAGAEVERQIAEQKRRNAEEAANRVAQSDFTPEEIAAQEEVGPSGEGYRERVLARWEEFVQEQANNIDNPEVRRQFTNDMLQKTDNLSRRAAIYETELRRNYSREQANQSLSTLSNRITADPAAYEQHLNDGRAVLKAMPDKTEAERAAMVRAWEQRAAYQRFLGLINSAGTLPDIDTTAAELTDASDTDWQARLNPNDYADVLSKLTTKRNSIMTKLKAEARSILSDVEVRLQNGVRVREAEINDALNIAKQTADVDLYTRAVRAARDQSIVRGSKGMPVPDMLRRSREAKGAVDATYPDLPPVVSDAVSRARDVFGVSAAAVGGIVAREYGVNLQPSQRSTDFDAAFVGDTARSELPRQVQNMLDDAGFAAQTPLNVVEVYNNGAAAISLEGMDYSQRAAVAGALVDAGFTNFWQEDDKLRVDARPSVSKEFTTDEYGRVWTGYSYVEPAVAKVLLERGFQAEAAAEALKRNPIQNGGTVDYGRGTSVLNAEGKPATTATGVGQFTEDTWLELLRDPSIAALLGADDPNMTREEKLALRADPEASVMAIGANAARNRVALQNSLGRLVSDSELYMAHFLGAGGAATLIKAREKNPMAAAAEMLPSAAASNRPVFFEKGRALSVAEVYDNLSQGFATAPSNIAHGDAEMWSKLAEAKADQLKEDPMRVASDDGVVAPAPLDGTEAFAQRAKDAAEAADYYNIPVEDMKPFTSDEAVELTEAIKNGDTDDVIEMLIGVAEMPGEMGDAALRQLDDTDRVFAFAAGLYKETRNVSVARGIIQGRRRINDNPGIVTGLNIAKADTALAFEDKVDGALSLVEARDRQAVQDAAFALYIERAALSGNLDAYDEDAYQQAVEDVLGGELQAVNGRTTLLPIGVNADTFETAISKMTMGDWMAASTHFEPPRYEDGSVVELEDLREGATFRAIGGNQYIVHLDNGALVSNRTGRLGERAAYVFKANPAQLRKIAARSHEVARAPRAEKPTGTADPRLDKGPGLELLQ